MSKRVVIVGAGIGGLATANLLAKAGYKVSVYEKNAQPGGRAGILELKGFRFDTGPSWYLMPDVFTHYFSLFRKTITKELDLVQLSPAYKVFFENASPITITSDSEQDAATFDAIEPGAGKKLKEYVRKGDDIYRLSMKHFLYTNFSSVRDFTKTDVLRRGHVMTRLALMPISTYVAKFVTDRRLQQILEYPMVFLGSSPFSAPALYSLMSALDFHEGVYYPKGGLYTIIERLVKLGQELGVEYHYGAAVKRIVTSQGEVRGITLEDGAHISADIVISNADLHFTETHLLDEKDRSYPASYWDKREAGPSALLMYLGVKGEMPELEHHNLFFVDNWKKNFDNIFVNKRLPWPASMYVCKPSATDPSVAPKGHENMFVLVPLPAGTKATNAQLGKAAEKYLSLLEEKLGVKDLKQRIVLKKFFGPNDFSRKFHAWQGTALGPSHTLRQSAFFRTPNKSKKVSGLYYVGGSTTPGIGLPMCLIGAELLYKRLAGDKRGGPIDKIRNIAKEEDY
tara:strand:+ start:2155 stop:3687 length:1533 start_codon:yes stop_codon:yes gene_type:complete